MRLRRQQDSPRALALLLCLCAVLLFLLVGPTAHGQVPKPSEPPSLTENLEQAEQTLTLLGSRLAERQKQVADLRASLREAAERLNDSTESLAALETQLAEAQASLEQSRTALAETSSSLTALSTRYDALEQSWQDYRVEMQKQVADLQRSRNRWKWGAVGAGVLAVVAGIISIAVR